MGFTIRKKSGNKIFDGTKLNVPGQGIATKKITQPDKIPFKDIKSSNSDTSQSN
jgi:hypothetical protein